MPEQNAGFVSLVGSSGAELPAVWLHWSILVFPLQKIFLSRLFLKDFSMYEGVYQDNWNVGQIRVVATATGLEVEMPRLDEMNVSYNPQWRPYTKHNFTTTIDGNDLLVRFEEDEQGRMTYIVHRAFVGQRID